jgi:hypothetical protein
MSLLLFSDNLLQTAISGGRTPIEENLIEETSLPSAIFFPSKGCQVEILIIMIEPGTLLMTG